MSNMSMKVLSVVVANADLPPNEIMSAVYAAFPRESYALLEGYIYQLKSKGYLSVLHDDNRIVEIHVNPSAYVALREGDDTSEKTSTQIHIGSIGNVSGQVTLGNNKDVSFDMRVSKTIINEMASGLKNVLPLAERRMTNELEREQLKHLVNRIVESLDKSEPPPKNLIEKLDSFLQKHSWISAPLAAAFINTLSKLG